MPATLLKNTPVKCFPVKFAKCLRTPFFTEHLSVTASAPPPLLLYFLKKVTKELFRSVVLTF